MAPALITILHYQGKVILAPNIGPAQRWIGKPRDQLSAELVNQTIWGLHGLNIGRYLPLYGEIQHNADSPSKAGMVIDSYGWDLRPINMIVRIYP